jgi:membrane AbrB-like protein
MIRVGPWGSTIADRAAALPRPLQWLALLCVSTLLALAWGRAGLPANLLFGPMIAGIVFGVGCIRLDVPRVPYVGAQALIGALVAANTTPVIVTTFGRDWPIFLAVMAATLLGAAVLGWAISRANVIPGSTAVYGITPGAASALVLLGEANGADVRLVAFMQYSRVLLVSLAAAVVARSLSDSGAAHAPAVPWFGPIHWDRLALVLVLAALSQQAARILRLPAWAVLGPMLVLATLHVFGLLAIELPRWLLALAYALLGWHIGLGFRREVLRHAWRALPAVAGATLGLMAFCFLLAWILTLVARVDLLTAYLATSPGGLDSVAIIAASSPQVDLPFVLALQSMRLVVVILLAPWITRVVVHLSPHLRPPYEGPS